MTQISSTISRPPPATCQELANRGHRAIQRLTRGLVVAVALLLMAFFAGHTGTTPHSAVVAIVAAPTQSHPTSAATPSQATTTGVSSASTGTPTTTATQPAGFGGQGDWWDPTTWIPDALGAAFKWIYDGFIQSFQEFIQWIFGLNLITTTDKANTYQNQAVTTAWGVMEGVAFSLLTVVIVWIGYSIMASGGLGANYRTAREMVPRIVLCGLAIHYSLLFASFLIDFNNALCSISFKTFNDLVTLWQPGDPNVAQAVFTVIFAIIAFLLLIQEFCRLALIDVLLITAPLGFLCWLTPETQGWARLWSSTFVSVVMVQAVQMMVLALGGSLIHLSAIGGAPGGVSNLLMGIATLYSAFKVPGWLRSLGGGHAANILQDTAGLASDVLVAARVAALFG